MKDFLKMIMDSLGMIPTERCHSYTQEMLAIQRISEIATSFAYLAFFFIVMSFVVGEKQRRYWVLKISLCSFVLVCGLGHGLSVLSGYYTDVLWLMTYVYFATAVSSWIGVIVTYYYCFKFNDNEKISFSTGSMTGIMNSSRKALIVISAFSFLVVFGSYVAIMTGSHNIIVVSTIGLSVPISIASSAMVYFLESQENYILWKNLVESKRRERESKQMFASISHDVRTPLNAIVQNATLAVELIKTGNTKDLQSTINTISDSATVQAEVIGKFLDIARCGSDDIVFSDFYVDDLISELCSVFKSSASEKGISIVQGKKTGIKIRSDRTRVSRSLMNIAGNAVKFTNNGTVSIYVLSDKRDVSFVVEDTGIGMDKDTMSRVFEDFFQGSNRERDPRKGFGLGLSVAKRLIEQLSGTIEVVSKPGVGSKFVVSVPKKPVASVLTFA